MQEQRLLSDLFQTEPSRWGYRGDPYLWREMKSTVDNYEYPKTEQGFNTLLEQVYDQLTGKPITDSEPIFIERFDHGGMSSGYISPKFWMEEARPMLLARYRESK